MSDSPRLLSNCSRTQSVRLLRVLSLPLVASLVFLFVVPPSVQPLQPSTATVRRQVVGVVESQFHAFRDGDYARAYACAASGIQQQFTVAAFERMVKDGFPVIAYWRTVSFGEVADNGREAVVQVAVQGRSGRTRGFRYLLIREAGAWRISGVVEINLSPAGPGQAA